MPHKKLIHWIINDMPENEWKAIEKRKVETYKKLFPIMQQYNIELTFNNTYTQIKKTTWKDEKPI